MTVWSTLDDPVAGHRRSGTGSPVVLLHGFTQTGLSWSRVADQLDPNFDVVVPDAPGHGRSASLRFSIADYASRLAASLPSSTYVGYSMGGRTALHAALGHPKSVRALVLIGSTPGIDDPAERSARRTADETLAQRLETCDLDDFLTEWLSQNLFATLSPDAYDLVDRRRNQPEGLASSLRLAGTGTQDPLWSRLGDITCPTVLISGQRDEKFTSIARRMASAMSAPVEHIVVPDRGHAVHLEDPTYIARLVNDVVHQHG